MINYRPMSDNELMALAQKDDGGAFAELIRRYEKRVRNTVRRSLSGDPSGVDDIVQYVFMSVWEKRQAYRGSARFTTYLFSVVRNCIVNHIRRAYRNSVEYTDDFDLVSNKYVHQIDRIQDIEREECGRAMDNVLCLPTKYRAALVLFAFGGFSTKEISRILGISVRAVSYRIAKARKGIKAGREV